MKKIIMFLVAIVLIALWGSQIVSAESYQRWVYWVNEPSHVMTASEMADITASLSRREISAQNTYRLSTGITYKIPQPDLYLQYILMCVKARETAIVTTQNVVDAIQGGDVVKWGNDISVRVRNYYFSSVHNRVQYIDNYSGASAGVFVLLINGEPKIKMECGNPLEVIKEVVFKTPQVPAPTPSAPVVAPAHVINIINLNVQIPPHNSEIVYPFIPIYNPWGVYYGSWGGGYMGNGSWGNGYMGNGSWGGGTRDYWRYSSPRSSPQRRLSRGGGSSRR